MTSNTQDPTQGPGSGETSRSTLAGGQKLLGRYILDRILGQGGMGVVWLARDEELEREVALKFLPEAMVNDRGSLSELKRELKRTLELTHPNIVRTFDFIQDATIAGISMEYVDADTLRNRRIVKPSGYFHPGELGEWMRQLCLALDYAHQQAAIVHRDLKPANLMINRKGQLKVSDFGISRSLVDSLTQITGKSGVSGTLVYMSPQQMTGETASPLDDVYSVGATIYELCTSRPPFYSGDISGQVQGKIAPSMRERRESLGLPAGEIEEHWEATIAACLSKDPARRPQSAGAIAVGLGLIEASALPSARPFVPQPVIRVSTSPGAGGPPSFPPPLTGPSTGATPLGAPPPLPPSFALAPRRGPAPILLAGVAAFVLLALAGAGWYFGFERPAAEKRAKEQAEADASHGGGGLVEPASSGNARGSIIVRTDPVNAFASVGDGPKRPSSGVIGDLKVGRQIVHFSLDGYDPLDVPVEVKEDAPTNLGTISLIRSTGALKIDCAAPDARYSLKYKLDRTIPFAGAVPLAPLHAPTGDYELTVFRPGLPPQTKAVTIVKDQERSVRFDFASGGPMIAKITPTPRILGAGADSDVPPPTLPALPDAPAATKRTITLAKAFDISPSPVSPRYEMPAGPYAARHEDPRGIYFAAPSKIKVKRASSTIEYDGGIFVTKATPAQFVLYCSTTPAGGGPFQMILLPPGFSSAQGKALFIRPPL